LAITVEGDDEEGCTRGWPDSVDHPGRSGDRGDQGQCVQGHVPRADGRRPRSQQADRHHEVPSGRSEARPAWRGGGAKCLFSCWAPGCRGQSTTIWPTGCWSRRPSSTTCRWPPPTARPSTMRGRTRGRPW